MSGKMVGGGKAFPTMRRAKEASAWYDARVPPQHEATFTINSGLPANFENSTVRPDSAVAVREWSFSPRRASIG